MHSERLPFLERALRRTLGRFSLPSSHYPFEKTLGPSAAHFATDQIGKETGDAHAPRFGPLADLLGQVIRHV
jgi:hypothetical protein